MRDQSDRSAAQPLAVALRVALERRASFMARLAGEGTDCYRLLHGTQEGAPGVTLDRYGDLALLQSFHARVDNHEVDAVGQVVDGFLPGLDLIYNDRSAAGSRVRNRLSPVQLQTAELRRTVCEHGVRFYVKARHRGHDPWLFLDLRPTRRALMAEAEGKSVLNLFAYTCGVGVCAAVGPSALEDSDAVGEGAHRVVNVDFSRRYLDVGTANAKLNGVANRCSEVLSDVFPAIRQLAGIRQPPVARGRRLPAFPHVDRESFDLVFLDPPPLAKSAFGVVDIRRDYQSLLKPALGAVGDGGVLYCTNNLAGVDQTEWHSLLRRCAEKHGRPIRSLDVLGPGEDFPSADNQPPLKVARLEL